MGFKAIHIASSVVLLIGCAFVLIGTVTSYWNYFHMQVGVRQGLLNLNSTSGGHRGLIWACHDDHMTMNEGAQSCISRFTDYSKLRISDAMKSMIESMSYKPWEMAALVMLCLSVAFGFGALFLAPLFCHKGCLCSFIHSVFVYLAALMGIIGMIVYLSYQLNSAMSQTTQYMKFDKFGWSFFVTIIGTLFQLLAAILYSVGACMNRNDGYQKGTREV